MSEQHRRDLDRLAQRVIAARLAMAIALAADGDGIPECIAAALNKWPGGYVGTDYLTGQTQIKLPFEDASL